MSIKKETEHLYENHQRLQNQPNFIEFCPEQVDDEISRINGLLAKFIKRVERFRSFILTRRLPPNELLVRSKHPLRPFSTRRIFNALERMQEYSPDCMTEACQPFSQEVFESIVQDLKDRDNSKKSGESTNEETRDRREGIPSEDYSLDHFFGNVFSSYNPNRCAL